MLDLEVAGAVRELTEAEAEAVNVPVVPKRLRDSHHAVARLLTQGLTPTQVSLQTGYSISRISVLQTYPAFIELMAAYRNDKNAERMAFEHRMALLAEDGVQELHERLHDNPETFSNETLLETVKVIADRAGFAPISRSINKSVTYNIGDRLDRARALMDKSDAA